MDNFKIFTESNDTGESLAAAVDITTNEMMPLASISGSLSGDADLFKIFLTGEQTFSATTASSRTAEIPVNQALGIPIEVVIDPKIFLFDEQGNAVYANDDLFGATQSVLPSGPGGFSPRASGLYYLGISGTGYEAISADGQIFPSEPFDQVVGPTGPGSGSPLTGFAGDTSKSSGEYTISLTGAQTIAANVVEPEDGDDDDGFGLNEAGDELTLARLNGASAVRFSLDRVAVGNASEVNIFRVNDGNLTKAGEFSLLRPGQIAAGFAPTFSLNANEGDTLQFRLTENGRARTATISSDSGNAQLNFGGGTSLSLAPDLAMAAPNLVVTGAPQGDDLGDDGAAIDFSTQAGANSEVRFAVYREAAFDSTAGLYVVDDLTGAVTVGGNTFQVGDDGYGAAALQRTIDVSLEAENGGVSTFTATVDNLLYGTFISVENSGSTETYFSYLGANGGNDHVKLLGNNALGFEDLPGLGDADYNDLVVTFEVV